MDFVRATDALTSCHSHNDVAKALDVSVQTVRQARMNPAADGHRPAPEGWQNAIAKLARARAAQLEALADELEG